MISTTQPNQPSFFELLDEKDQKKYLELQDAFSHSEMRYKRNKRLESLLDSLQEIKQFCIRNDSNDWKRCLVCGVCWMGQDIAINTRQLKLLIDKCKSSINGALSKMGYGTAPIKSSITAELLNYIPFLKGNFLEQRQWTVRRKIQFSPVPMAAQFFSPYPLKTPDPNFAYMQQYQIFTNTQNQIKEINHVFDLNNHHNMNSQISSPEGQTDASSSPEEVVIHSTRNENHAQDQNPTESSEEIQDPFADFATIPEEHENDVQYNLLYDPCCCCPVQWADDDADDYFLMS